MLLVNFGTLLSNWLKIFLNEVENAVILLPTPNNYIRYKKLLQEWKVYRTTEYYIDLSKYCYYNCYLSHFILIVYALLNQKKTLIRINIWITNTVWTEGFVSIQWLCNRLLLCSLEDVNIPTQYLQNPKNFKLCFYFLFLRKKVHV